ncbi:DUF4153 domain-containing protein [Pseudomonas cremoricolorata]|uniref:DUF4153 domain-containing protein n=1 Tax=Pseudomonas cremoricolorata TaxID=157783 RepID=UPI0003FDF2EC|nr:DUF4153 domain-containing protein [Pseudomonas cremoricolorata]
MPESQRPLPFYLIIGLIHGLVLMGLDLAGPPQSAFIYAACAGVTVCAVVLQLLGPQGVQRGTLFMALGLGLLVAGLSAYDRSSMDNAAVRDTAWLAIVVLSYIATAFILAWPNRQGLRPRYSDLFRHAWSTVFIVLLALGLMGVFFWLLWLCGTLFEVVGISQIKALLENHALLYVVLPVVFALGMRIGLQNEKVIGLLRGMLLSLCRLLLPLSAAIAVVFTCVLPFTGVQPIWATGQATAILLLLSAFNLFLVNGVFQDGEHGEAYPRGLRMLVNASLLCLPVLVALAAWASGLRIAQYGLTPSRIQAALLIGVMLVHALAAAGAVLPRHGAWLHGLRRSNPWIALLTALLIVAYQSPLLDPLGLSARNQVARLLDGRTPVDSFDANTLYFGWGEPGRQAFEALSKQVEAGTVLAPTERETLRQRLDDTREMGAVSSPAQPVLEWLGAKPKHAEAFTEVVNSDYECTQGCYLWAQDMDGDGQDEVLLIPRQRYAPSVTMFAWQDGAWKRAGVYTWNYARPAVNDFVKRIQAGELKPVTPRYKTFQVDGQELMLQREP